MPSKMHDKTKETISHDWRTTHCQEHHELRNNTDDIGLCKKDTIDMRKEMHCMHEKQQVVANKEVDKVEMGKHQ